MLTSIGTMTERIVPILKQYGVRKAGIFGSYARGDIGPESDLDLLVEFPPGASLLDLVGLQMDLKDELGIEVDANTYNALHPLIRDRVLSDEIRIL